MPRLVSGYAARMDLPQLTAASSLARLVRLQQDELTGLADRIAGEEGGARRDHVLRFTRLLAAHVGLQRLVAVPRLLAGDALTRENLVWAEERLVDAVLNAEEALDDGDDFGPSWSRVLLALVSYSQKWAVALRTHLPADWEERDQQVVEGVAERWSQESAVIGRNFAEMLHITLEQLAEDDPVSSRPYDASTVAVPQV